MHTIKITYNSHDNNMYAYRQKNCITWKYFCQTFIAVIGSHLEDVWEVSEVEDVVEFDGCWKKSGCHLREEGRKEGREGGREHEWVQKLEERTEIDENSDPWPYGPSS